MTGVTGSGGRESEPLCVTGLAGLKPMVNTEKRMRGYYLAILTGILSQDVHQSRRRTNDPTGRWPPNRQQLPSTPEG
jgi:hypothetical protein